MIDKSLCHSRVITEILPIRKCNTSTNTPNYMSSPRDTAPIKYSSTYWTSIIQPKRKFGNVHLFAQLLHK